MAPAEPALGQAQSARGQEGLMATVARARGNVSKRYAAAAARIEPERQYSLEEGIALARETSAAKFDESVDLSLRLGVDPKHADQMVRGAVVLPHGIGKTVRVAVFAKGEREREAREAGADIVGAEDLVERIQGGFMEFDTAVATPDLMGQVGRLGKILGPRGLMPNPKLGTVTFDVGRAVREAKAGKVEFRVDKAGNIHVPVGKRSFSGEYLVANAMALLEAVMRARPSAAKGTYLRGLSVSSTMGPAVRIDATRVSNLFRK
jgi:large subunit ribosomal protein L1